MQIPVVNLKQTGQNIYLLREQSGISVKELQLLLGFATPQAIYKWQHGDSLPTVDNLVALSAIFSVLIARIKTPHKDSLIYFGTISGSNEEDYKTSIEGYDDNKLKDDYVRQIHICSRICTKKFKAYNAAVVSSVVGIIAFQPRCLKRKGCRCDRSRRCRNERGRGQSHA